MASESGKVAIVTGANRGLGLETCRLLAKRGYRVVLTARSRETAAGAAAELARGGKVDVRPAPLT